jgi:hypothetical protein
LRGNLAQSAEQDHDRVVGEAVEDALAIAARRGETRAPELLQVLRGVGDGDPRLRGERVDAALALRELLDQLEPVSVAERLRDRGQLGEDTALGALT